MSRSSRRRWCWWRKKRLCSLAEWHFGGGDGYCAACEGLCPDCPRNEHRPETLEGQQLWQLVLRLGGQIRFASAGMAGAIITGWDMTAALALGEAMGLSRLLVAEILPDIESVMVRKLREARGND